MSAKLQCWLLWSPLDVLMASLMDIILGTVNLVTFPLGLFVPELREGTSAERVRY